MSDELWRRVSALDDDIDQEVDERASRLNSMYEKRLKSRRDQLKAKLPELKTGEDRRFTQQTVRASAIRTSILQDVEDLEDISKKWQSALRRIGSKIEDRFKVSDESAGRFNRDDKAIIDALIGAQNKTGYIGQLIETDQYHRRVLADAVTRHVLGRTTPEQLTDDIERLTKRSSSEARRLFHDGAQAFSRTVTLSKAKKLGYERFQYLGPEDGANRPFCAEHVDKIYTREEIDELSNGQGLDVWTFAGGYNCRHSWRPVRSEWLEPNEEQVQQDESNSESPDNSVNEPTENAPVDYVALFRQGRFNTSDILDAMSDDELHEVREFAEEMVAEFTDNTSNRLAELMKMAVDQEFKTVYEANNHSYSFEVDDEEFLFGRLAVRLLHRETQDYIGGGHVGPLFRGVGAENYEEALRLRNSTESWSIDYSAAQKFAEERGGLVLVADDVDAENILVFYEGPNWYSEYDESEYVIITISDFDFEAE